MLDDQTIVTHISGQFPLTPKISTGNDDNSDSNDNNDDSNDFDNNGNNVYAIFRKNFQHFLKYSVVCPEI